MTDRLDLKYRPRKFAHVLGNKGVVELLLKRSRDGTLAGQSMMFGGPKGCGKTSMARIVARAILCSDLSDGEPCGECHACHSVLDEASADVEEMDAASQGTVDRVRSMVRDTDYEGRRVYLMDEAQRLTAQAQDALLKPVEEGLFTIILCTTEPHKVKATIRDRVEEYSVYPPSAEEMGGRLVDVCSKEGIQADPEALKIVVSMTKCHPRKCLMSVGAMAAIGAVTQDAVKSFFRFNSYSAVATVLTLLDQDPRKAFETLDSLAASESPSWIRDQIVGAISSAMRVDVGAKATYPVPTHFFQNRLQGWTEVSRFLVLVDRPVMADIESVLLSTLPSMRPSAPVRQAAPLAPVYETPASLPEASVPVEKASPSAPGAAAPAEAARLPESLPSAPPKVKAQQPPAKPPPRPKSVEIDGVIFSAEEKLTSLDVKMGPSSPPDVPADPASVEFDRDYAPITDREFARGLVGRLRGG